MAKRSKKSSKILPEFSSLKEEKLFENLLRTAQQFVQGKAYRPLTAHDLFDRLRLSPQHQSLFIHILKTLESLGILELVDDRYIHKSKKKPIEQEVVTGIVRMHPRGFGFVKLDDVSLYAEDIFIPKHMTQNAVDGDTVEVSVNTESISEKGPEGRIITILTRGRTHIAGVIRSCRHDQIQAYVPLLGISQRISVAKSEEFDLQVGDRVIMEVMDWGSKETETLCRVSHYLGHISDPTCDIPAAIEEFELRKDFPSKAVKEAEIHGKSVKRGDIAQREDLRSEECFTIDPETAKDFDDALSLSKNKDGSYHLGVHIADVSHYVTTGSALDKEARQRCNSTYFPAYCLPMLPSELSDNLCSLKPKVNRLTASVFMSFTPEGELAEYRISRTVIKSAKRFSYQEAKDVLDRKKSSKHLPTLNLMVELCKLLKKKRYERGSIEFCLPETIVVVGQDGVPTGTKTIEYDITHQLVEEFMLKANEVVATHLSKLGKNITYRIHDVPAEENLKDFSILASAFGFALPEKPSPKDLQGLFDEALETSYGQYLATSYIRRMRLAQYSPDNIGHYGLGLTHYCHFTSPIRRYVDLVVHRVLFGESDDREKIELVAHDCSEQERISAKAEGSVLLLKKLRLLRNLTKDEPHREFEAVVTRVKNFGLTFEVLELMLEGFLHVSDLDNDYYVFEESTLILRGARHGLAYKAGDRIHVMLKEADLILRDTSWHLVPEARSKQHAKTGKKPVKKYAPKQTRTEPPKSSLKTGRSKPGKTTTEHIIKKRSRKTPGTDKQ